MEMKTDMDEMSQEFGSGHEDALAWNSSNTTELMFINPFSVLFYRSIFIVIYGIIFAVCIVGNLMVLFVTITSARMKTRTYFFLSNLAVADLLVGILCIPPNLMTFLYPSWLLGKVMCKLYYFSESFSFCASVLLLAVIALERYIAVMHPLKARFIFTRGRMHIMQVVIWIFAACYNIPLFVIFDTFDVGNNLTLCSFNELFLIDMRSYYTINFVLWYVIPLFTMCFVYAIIAWTLWNSDLIFGYSSTDVGGNGSGDLVPNSRTKKSKAESSSSGDSSGYSEGTSSVQGVLRSAKFKKEDRMHSTCFCCHSDVDNNINMAEDFRSDTKNQSPYASMENSIARHNVHNNSVLACWSCSSAHSDSSGRKVSQFSRATPSTRATFSPSGRSYELSCLNPNCRHHRHSYEKRDQSPNHGSLRHQHRLEKLDSLITNTSITRRMSMSLRVLSSRRKVVRLLVVVMLTFAVCVLPHHVRLLMHYWNVYPNSSFKMVFFPPISFICLYLNSALNPVLYSLFSQSFRRSLKECLRKPWHRWKSCISNKNFMKWENTKPRFYQRKRKL